jgi:signal peptidase I
MNDIEPEKKSNSLEEAKSLFYVGMIALAIRIFILELYFVPTGSMKATILENDYIFSTKYSYGYSKYSFPFSPNIFEGRIFPSQPERGDIVIFRPPNNMDIRYVKRLIGLPGDKIQLINDVIYINDRPVERSEIGEFQDVSGQLYKKYKETLPNNVSYYSYKLVRVSQTNHYSNTEIFYVPSGKYFFLGDNRDESLDSRVGLGFVPFENFISKGQFVLFSTQEILWRDDKDVGENIVRFWLWLKSIRFNRIFKSLKITYNHHLTVIV